MAEDKEFNVTGPNVPGVKLPTPVEEKPAADLGQIEEGLPENAIFNRLTDTAARLESQARAKLSGRSKSTIGVANLINVEGRQMDEESALTNLAIDMNSLDKAGISLDKAVSPKVLSQTIPVRNPKNMNYAEEHRVAGEVVDRGRRLINGLAQMGLGTDEILDRLRTVYNPSNPEETKRQITAIIDISKARRER